VFEEAALKYAGGEGPDKLRRLPVVKIESITPFFNLVQDFLALDVSSSKYFNSPDSE
jgi:hypothetical protein